MEDGTIALFSIGVALAILVPALRFLRTNVFPRSVVFIDHNGKELGEISPELIQQSNLADLERMHDRVVGEKHLRIRAVA